MLLYDNRGRLRVLCQLYGSIYRRVWLAAILITMYSVTLHVVFWKIRPDIMPEMDHPFAAQSLSVLIAFSVCFRTNIAWDRFWESCREVVFMYSKWCDAYSQLQGFISSTVKRSGPGVLQERLECARFELTHYFSLLSAVAVERLMRGDIHRMQLRRRRGVAWNEQIVFRENLRYHDLTGSQNLCKMRVLDINNLQSHTTTTAPDETMEDPSSETKTGMFMRRSPSMEKMRRFGKAATKRPTLFQMDGADHDWQAPVPIIGDLSAEELRRLKKSQDRVNLVISWINELVTDMVPLLSVPAPILSRVYQQVSDGALGYSQAEKLADIPFPFIFAQILALSILVISIFSPVAFTIITGDSPLTPVVSSVVVLSFWSLNEIAKELENPFGSEANNLPINDNHERFIHFLAEIHGIVLPTDRAFKEPDRGSFCSSATESHGTAPLRLENLGGISATLGATLRIPSKEHAPAARGAAAGPDQGAGGGGALPQNVGAPRVTGVRSDGDGTCPHNIGMTMMGPEAGEAVPAEEAAGGGTGHLVRLAG